MPTLYELLEVAEQATPAELRRAYRRLVLLTHPDRTPDPAAHQRYLVINEAYEILSQPSRRVAYDALLHRQRQPVEPLRPSPASAPPASRRRPPVGARPPRKTRASTEVDIRPYNRPALLLCRVLMGLALVVLLDYFGLAHTVRTEDVRLTTYRSNAGVVISTIVTRYGSFDTSYYFPEAVPPLEIRTSWLFHFVHQARLPNGISLPLKFSYGSIMTFTVLLLLLTAAAQLPKVKPAARVNLAIGASVLGLIVVLMAIFST